MIENILRSVYDILGENYSDTNIYDEITKQGFKTPCFCVCIKSVRDELFRGKRYKYGVGIEIRYYSENSDKIKAGQVMEELFDHLEYINPDNIGLIRAGTITNEDCGDYFKLNVDYEFFYLKKETTDIMGKVEISMKF